MSFFRRPHSAYRSLIVVALGTLIITGCRQGMTTTSGPEVSSEAPSSLQVYPALGATAVVGEDLSSVVEYPTYYLYILDRDGVPVQRFECDGQYIDRDHASYCRLADGTYTVVSAAVPSLLTAEQLPLKGEPPAPEQ